MTDTTLPEDFGTKARFMARLENGSDEWLELRKTGLGGSDIGTIMGLNPYESAFTRWAKKTGRIDDTVPMNEAMEWGNRLEPVVLDKFADEHPELIVHRNVGTWAHPERDWAIANPDAIFQLGDEFGIVEVKTAQYEDAWSDGVPAHYEAQVQHYLDVFGYARAYVVVLFHGNRFREYEMEANGLFQELALERCVEFLDLVASDTQPEFDGALSTYTTLRALHPEITDDEVELGWLGVQYFSAEKAYRDAEAELNVVKSNILDSMGSAKRGLVDGSWTFSRQARGSGTPYLVTKRG